MAYILTMDELVALSVDDLATMARVARPTSHRSYGAAWLREVAHLAILARGTQGMPIGLSDALIPRDYLVRWDTFGDLEMWERFNAETDRASISLLWTLGCIMERVGRELIGHLNREREDASTGTTHHRELIGHLNREREDASTGATNHQEALALLRERLDRLHPASDADHSPHIHVSVHGADDVPVVQEDTATPDELHGRLARTTISMVEGAYREFSYRQFRHYRDHILFMTGTFREKHAAWLACEECTMHRCSDATEQCRNAIVEFMNIHTAITAEINAGVITTMDGLHRRDLILIGRSTERYGWCTAVNMYVTRGWEGYESPYWHFDEDEGTCWHYSDRPSYDLRGMECADLSNQDSHRV